jgi:hypothetical protein
MADRLTTNVLPFEPPDSAPGTQLSPDASRLLGVCRDRLVHGVATAFAGNLGRATDTLLGMADRATSLDQQQLYFAAMDFLSKRGQVLLQHFRSSFVNHFDASLAALRRSRRVEQSFELGDLKLIDTEDFERDLAIGKLSARATCNCANQLTALDRRLAVLLRLPRVGQDDNPLYPRALFAAMLNAFGEMHVGQQLGLIVLQEFERQTAAELPGIYNDLNRHLVEYGILPKIPLAAPSPGEALEGEPRFGGGAPGGLERNELLSLEPGPAAAPSRAPQGRGAPLTGDEVFAQLVRAIQAAAAPGGASAPIAAPQPGPLTGALGPQPGAQYQGYARAPLPAPANPVLELAQLIEALTSLQRGRTEPFSLPGLGQVQIDPARANTLQEIRSTPLASASQPVDAMTIDIVAMLFDAIFNDPDLPAALRAEIAKLQIPVLKVALMDKTFFSNKRHPARRLLDAIAGSAVGRSEADEPRLIGKIASIVDEVVVKFETDIDIFAAQVGKLDEFLKDEEARARTRTGPVVDKLQQADRQELATARAAAEIRTRIHRRNVPTLVADFLDRHWRQVLIRAFVRSGDEGATWVESLGAMDDLLWSVEPKRGPEERNLLLTTLPDLLKRLRTGLESVDLIGVWDAFFAQLIRLHVGALHKEIPEEEYRSAPPAAEDSDDTDLALEDSDSHSGIHLDPPSRIELHVPERQGSAPKGSASGAEPAAPPAAPRAAASGAGEDRHLKRAQSLEVGAWVEFQSFRGTRKTLRLSWVSEFRGVLLFTNRQGENALTIPTASLAQHLRKGTARVLSPERITDRAVTSLLTKVETAGLPLIH